MFFVLITGTSCTTGQSLGVKDGKLAPCPDSPNCVSTQSDDRGRAMKPLPFVGTRFESRERIMKIIEGMKRSTIVIVTDSYIHAEFKSALWRFVDDVEFLLDENTRLVQFRSASRVGFYDFGVNRKRMKEISTSYLKSLEK
jgi:uncharacterized protein (DUF1499 family)